MSRPVPPFCLSTVRHLGGGLFRTRTEPFRDFNAADGAARRFMRKWATSLPTATVYEHQPARGGFTERTRRVYSWTQTTT